MSHGGDNLWHILSLVVVGATASNWAVESHGGTLYGRQILSDVNVGAIASYMASKKVQGGVRSVQTAGCESSHSRDLNVNVGHSTGSQSIVVVV